MSEDDFEWTKFKEVNVISVAEIESSKYISGHHGEYDISIGSFYCYNPMQRGYSSVEELARATE